MWPVLHSGRIRKVGLSQYSIQVLSGVIGCWVIKAIHQVIKRIHGDIKLKKFMVWYNIRVNLRRFPTKPQTCVEL